MHCTSMDAEETDMFYVDKGGKSLPPSYIGIIMRQLCVNLFTSTLALMCLMDVAVSAQYQEGKVLFQSTKPIVAVRFTPSRRVIAVSEDGAAALWDCDIGRAIWNISLARAPRKNDYTRIKIKAMDLSPDGGTVVVAYVRSGVDRNLIDEKAGDTTKQKDSVWETHVVLIDTTDGTIKKDIAEVGDTSITAVGFASGKNVFVTTTTSMARALMTHQSPTSTTHVLNIDTGQMPRYFKSRGWIASAALSPNDGRFATAALQYVEGDTAFYELQFYDSDTGKLLDSSEFATTRTAAISFSIDGSILAVSRSGKDGLQVDLVRKDGMQKLTHIVAAAKSIESRAVAFVGTQQRLALAGGRLPISGFDDIGTPRFKDLGGVVIVIDQSTGKKLTSYEFKSFVTSLALTPDGSKMAVGMYDGKIAIVTPF